MPNLRRLERACAQLTVDACIIDHPIDIYYLTGLDLSQGRLILFKHQPPVLCVDGRYEEVCHQQTTIAVKRWEGREALPVDLPETVGFDAVTTTYAHYETLRTLVHGTLVPLHRPLAAQRMIKDAHEIAVLTQAAALGSAGYDHVLTCLQEGISEREVACALEVFWLQHGGEGLAFAPIIAFGENSSKPHHRASTRTLRQGDVVLIDIGVRQQHYHSDMTRVVYFGLPSPRIQGLYDRVMHAMHVALALCRPGVAVGAIDAAVRTLIESWGYPFVHSLGHGIGLDVHEPPRLRTGIPDATDLLQPGMVLTIEPGIYLPGEGGVRLEDTICITSSGYVSLTQRPFVLCDQKS